MYLVCGVQSLQRTGTATEREKRGIQCRTSNRDNQNDLQSENTDPIFRTDI